MGLYKLFSYNVEIQYKSYFLSKAMLFTVVIALLNLILPFLVAYKSKGFWLKSHFFHEQPTVKFTYEYLLVAETEDPSQLVVCSDTISLDNENFNTEENCAEIQIQEYDYNGDDVNDALHLKLYLNVPPPRSIASVMLIIGLDFQLKTSCPLHMNSLAIINKEFSVPPSGLNYYGDLQLYQVSHLPCFHNIIDTNYNNSLLNYIKDDNNNVVDFLLESYFRRRVTTEIKTMNSRSQNGHTGTMFLNIHIRIPEMKIWYTPNLLQELKWAWPQYLSLMIIFYWLFNKIKRFVFSNRLLMAWEVIPWKGSLAKLNNNIN